MLLNVYKNVEKQVSIIFVLHFCPINLNCCSTTHQNTESDPRAPTYYFVATDDNPGLSDGELFFIILLHISTTQLIIQNLKTKLQ